MGFSIHPTEGNDCILALYPSRSFHESVKEDTLQHLLSFLDDEDLYELIHVDRNFLRSVRKTKRNVFRYTCEGCNRTKRTCQCKLRARVLSCAYFIFLLGLVAFCFFFAFRRY